MTGGVTPDGAMAADDRRFMPALSVGAGGSGAAAATSQDSTLAKRSLKKGVELLEPKVAIDRLVKVETSSREDVVRADEKARVVDEAGSLAKGVMPNFGCGVETDGS